MIAGYRVVHLADVPAITRWWLASSIDQIVTASTSATRQASVTRDCDPPAPINLVVAHKLPRVMRKGLTKAHRQTEASSCLAFAISALALASLIFIFAIARLQK